MRWQELQKQIVSIIDGKLVAFGGPPVPENAEGRLREAQIATLARHTPAVMLGNVLNASIMISTFWGSEKMLPVAGWALLVCSAALFLYLRRRTAEPRLAGRTVSKSAIHRSIVYALVMGALWAIPPLAFFHGASAPQQIVVISMAVGMLCGGALSLAAIPAAGMSFITPIVFASAIGLGTADGLIYRLIAALLIIYTFIIVRIMIVVAGQTATRFLAEFDNEQAAMTDTLTKLANAKAFSAKLEVAVDRVGRLGEDYCVMLVDIDRFKEFNETFGHAGGDELLVQTASRLSICIRQQDLVARMNGDEFAILLHALGSADRAAAIAERIRASFEIPFQLRGQSVQANATVGIALLPADGHDAQTVMERAREAMYAAKRVRRGSYKFVTSDDELRVRTRQEIKKDLRIAIARKQFHLEFQPFMDLRTGLTTGFETLLRWNHPERGPISPSEFVPLAEEAGLIHEIGEWVIRKAIAEAALWPDHLRVSINVSAAQFRTLEISSIIQREIEKAAISPDRVEIEITESMILTDIDRVKRTLERLRGLGVRISLDDFGTGYSSLSHLVRLPIDRIKIDQFFTMQSCTSDECRKMVRAIIRLAQELDIDVIAEGVETIEQLRLLKEMGCGEAQGFYIGRPMAHILYSDMTVSCLPLGAQAA